MVPTAPTTGFVNGDGSASFRGLMYFDFHPDFDNAGTPGYQKVYTGYQIDRNFDNGGESADYRIQNFNNRSGGNQYAIAEWSISSTDPNAIDPSSYREVFRFQAEPGNPHALGEIAFNTNAKPGDDDYGLLYAAVTDGNANGNSPPASDYLQDLSNPFGSIIRINPLQDGADSYSIPMSNPYFGQPGVAEEIYAYGFRDSQTFSFGKDFAGEDVLITFDIGQLEREEVNLVRPGGNYGWERYEGTRLNNPNTELVPGSVHSPPVVEYDHTTGGFAIIGGLLVSDPTNPSFRDKVIFSDLPTGKIFYADYDEMLRAEISGTQAEVFEINTFTRDGVTVVENSGGGATNPGVTFEDVVSQLRGDARFGADESGRVFIVTKQSNSVFLTGLVTSEHVFGDDLELVVNVDTGGVTIVGLNGATPSLKGYSLNSSSNSLDSGAWQSLADDPAHAGWQVANANSAALNELNPSGSTPVGPAGIELGTPFSVATSGSLGVPTLATDTRFEYVTAEGEVLRARVRHEGLTLANNLLLTIDPITGEAELTNSSLSVLGLRGYSILSESGSLEPQNGGWSSLQDQSVAGVQEANATPSALSELAPDATLPVIVLPGQTINLGTLFDMNGIQDLQLEFLYSELTLPTGDYNSDGIVDAADYTVWRDSLGSDGDELTNRDPSITGPVGGSDYLAWRANFGTAFTTSELSVLKGVVSYAALASASGFSTDTVPEANTALLLTLPVALAYGSRRQTHSAGRPPKAR